MSRAGLCVIVFISAFPLCACVRACVRMCACVRVYACGIHVYVCARVHVCVCVCVCVCVRARSVCVEYYRKEIRIPT